MPADIPCCRCGLEFLAKRSDARFCPACRKERAKERAALYDTHHRDVCPNCGTSIVRRAKLCLPCENRSRKDKYLGENNPNWHKGRTISQGYIMVRTKPGTHKKGGGAYEREHRVVWEQHHGPLPKGHIIHHLNGIKHDNRIENLAAMSRSEHHVRHAEPYERRIRELEALLGIGETHGQR